MGRFGLKIAMCPIFMKFGTQNKSNMLIINIFIGIDDLDPKLKVYKITKFQVIREDAFFQWWF